MADGPNGVGGVIAVASADVDDVVARFFEAYDKRTRTTSRDIIGFQALYERICSFLDGNGGTGRVIMFQGHLRGRQSSQDVLG